MEYTLGTRMSSVHFVTEMRHVARGRITQHYNFSDHGDPGWKAQPRDTRYDYPKVFKRLVLVSLISQLGSRIANFVQSYYLCSD